MHHVRRFLDQLVELSCIEALAARPQFQVGFHAQDDAPFRTLAFPFMPASQCVVVIVPALTKGAILAHAAAAQQLTGFVSFHRSAELNRYRVEQ